MKRIKNSPFIFLLLMIAFSIIMMFGIFFGSKLPQIFFWGIIIILTAILVIYVAPTIKETILLVVGMIVFAIVVYLTDIFIQPLFGAHRILGDIACMICIAPIYFPLVSYFLKLCLKMIKRDQSDDSKE